MGERYHTQGRIIMDCEGAAKRRLRADELLRRFEDLRRRELLDEGAAELIRAAYVRILADTSCNNPASLLA